MHVVKVVSACTRDVSGLMEFVIGSSYGTCLISDDTMQPTLYARPGLTGTPDNSGWWLHTRARYASWHWQPIQPVQAST